MAVNVLAPTGLNFYLEYGTQPNSYTVQTPTRALAANVPQELTLGTLQSNTRYYYRLRFQAPGSSTFDASPEYSFITQRPAGSTFTFCVQGDSHPERANSMFNSAYYTRTLQTVAAATV